MIRKFNGMGTMITCSTLVVLLSLSFGCGLDRAPYAEARLKSSNQMKELILSMRNYHSVHGQWPNTFSDIKPMTESPFDLLISNPVTGDMPGYEYVKPTDEIDTKTTVVLYQLRSGQRATDLRVGYADGRVAEFDPEAVMNQ